MLAERLTDVIAWHGEGPVWWPEWGLRICDGYRGDIVGIDIASGAETERLHVSDYIGAFRPRIGGGMVAGVERGFALIESGGRVTVLPPVWDDPGIRMNDGACDWNGAFYCGSMREDPPREGVGSLYRLDDPALEPSVRLRGQGIPNGLVFDRDRGCAFYIDTLTKSVRVYDELDGASGWGAGRISVDLGHLEQGPDGMTMDAAGNLWVALWGATGAVHCYQPGSSTPVDVIEVPDAHHVTAPVFGGDDLGTLFITTSQQADGAGRAAGSVYAARPGVTGRLPWVYRH